MSIISSLYTQLFGKDHIKDGNVIDFSEHGRTGGLSTGQGFKFVTPIDSNSGDLLGGSSRFSTNDFEEATGSILYVGKESASGEWWLTKIDTSTSALPIQHATVTNNSSVTSYSDAWTNRATLTYSDYSGAF